MRRLFLALALVPFLGSATPLPARKIEGTPKPDCVKNPRKCFEAKDFNALLDHTSGWVNVRSYGAKGDGTTDDTAAIQAAIATGKNVRIPAGVYMVDPVTVPSAMKGHAVEGEGFYHYGSNNSTVIKARSDAQASIFALANGADNVTFRGLRIDGDSKAAIGIDGTYGAFLSLEEVGVYKTTAFGFYGKQGLARIRRCFFQNLGVGAHVFSDTSITDSEFTGGTEPLKLVAGGNRLVNVWANSGSVSQVTLAPFDASTNHINTSIVNLYAGETTGGASEVPIVKIAGTATNRVQAVQISGGHLVCAAPPDKINIGIDVSYATDVAITGLSVLGNVSPSATRHLSHGLVAANVTNLAITGGTWRAVTKNPIVLGAAVYGVSISGVVLSEFATSVATGTEGAGILVTDANDYGSIANVVFDTASAATVPYAMEGGNPSRFAWSSNLIRYPSTTVWNPATGAAMGGYQLVGANPRPPGILAGFATYDPPSLATGAGATTTITVTGAALGDYVAGWSFTNDTAGITVTSWVSAANTVSFRFQNDTGGTIDLASGTLRARVQKL